MNWQKPAAATEEVPTPPWALEAKPSVTTTYAIYDNGDGTYTAVVMEKKGSASGNMLLAEKMSSLIGLQTVCESDWATGARK